MFLLCLCSFLLLLVLSTQVRQKCPSVLLQLQKAYPNSSYKPPVMENAAGNETCATGWAGISPRTPVVRGSKGGVGAAGGSMGGAGGASALMYRSPSAGAGLGASGRIRALRS